MNKQEILNEINKTRKHLTNMEKMLGGCFRHHQQNEGVINEEWKNKYSYDHFDRILPIERENLVALIMFLYDYISDLERIINEKS